VKEYGAWFELADWRAIPEEYQSEYVDPWLVTAQTVMQKLAEEPLVGDGQEVAYTFERKKELEYKAGAALEVLKQYPGVPAKEKMGGLSFGDKTEYPRLQAADLVAYELYKQIENILDGNPREDRYPLKRLMDHGFLSGRVFPMKMPSPLQALALPIAGLGKPPGRA
jgi:hypothetical protein